MMQYDKEYVQKWREKAITKSEELQVGMQVWGGGTNSNKGGVITEIISDRQKDARRGTPSSRFMSDEALDAPAWVYLNDGSYFAIKDRGVGADYNPWLILNSEELAKEYYAGLVVTFTVDPYDRYDYPDYEEYAFIEPGDYN